MANVTITKSEQLVLLKKEAQKAKFEFERSLEAVWESLPEELRSKTQYYSIVYDQMYKAVCVQS